MGLGYDLTLNHPDLTPLYIKAMDTGVYSEKAGDSFSVNTATGSINTLRYWEYNASMYLNGTNQYIGITNTDGINLVTNQADKTKAGHRLLAAFIPDNTTNNKTYPLYEWYLDANNYERLTMTCNGGGLFTITYDAVVGGVALYAMSAAGVALNTGWNVFQVHHNYTGVNRQAAVFINGQSTIAFTNSAAATTINFAAAQFVIGRSISLNTYSEMYFDLFLVRRGLPFCLSWTDQPTDPAWQGVGYLNRPYQGGYIVPKDLGTNVPIAPSCFPENTVPQGIPCAVVARDVTYVVGIGNYKVYKLLNYTGWATNPGTPILASQSFLNLHKDSFYGNLFRSYQSANAGTVEAGTYLAGISFFNSKTGEETEISSWIGDNTGGTNRNVSDSVVTLGGAFKYAIQVFKREQTVFYDKIKFWKKNTADNKIYYCGMARADGTSTTVISSNFINCTIEDNTVLTECQEFTKFVIPDLYCVDKLGLPKPVAPTFNSTGAGAGFNSGDYEIRLFNIDPRTGTRSGLSNPLAHNLVGAVASIIVNQPTLNRLNDWYALGAAARYVTGGEQNYTTYLNSASLNINQLNAPSGVTYTLSSLYASGILTDLTLNLPDPCDYVEYHDDRLFYACFNDAKHKVQWSQVDDLELVSDNDYLLIGDANDPITGLKSIGGVLVVTTVKTFGIIVGTGGSYNYQRLSSEFGNVSNKTIQLIKGNLYFCSSNGPCVYTGADFKFIGDPIKDIFKTMDARMRPLMTSTVDSQNNLYLLGIRTDSSQTSADSLDTISYQYNNNKIYAYNYEDSDLSEGIYIWTELNIPHSDMATILLNDKEETLALLNLIPNTGSNPITSPGNSGVGFINQNSYSDYGNYLTNNISWSIVFDPLYAKFGRNNMWTEVNFFPITDQLTTNNTYTCGYQVKGVDYTSNLIANNDVENLQKKMSIRGRYAAAIISGSTIEQFILAGYTMKMQEVGYR